MNFTNYIENEEDFKDLVKSEIRNRAFEKIEDMKKEMANEFLQDKEEEQ